MVAAWMAPPVLQEQVQQVHCSCSSYVVLLSMVAAWMAPLVLQKEQAQQVHRSCSSHDALLTEHGGCMNGAPDAAGTSAASPAYVLQMQWPQMLQPTQHRPRMGITGAGSLFEPLLKYYTLFKVFLRHTWPGT